MLTFRKAEKEEQAAVLGVYRLVTGLPFCVWNEAYPGEFEVSHDTETGNLYLLEDGKRIIGTVSVVPENELDDLDAWRIRENAAEIARVAVIPDEQGKGFAHVLVREILSVLRERGIRAVHLMAAEGNLPARKTYLSAGFVPVGECDMYGNHYILMEKALS